MAGSTWFGGRRRDESARKKQDIGWIKKAFLGKRLLFFPERKKRRGKTERGKRDSKKEENAEVSENCVERRNSVSEKLIDPRPEFILKFDAMRNIFT